MLIITDVPQRGAPDAEALTLGTPLEMIFYLERANAAISSVVLEGSFAGNRELATALHELYPDLAIARHDERGWAAC